MEHLLNIIASKTHVSKKDILSRVNDQDTVKARRILLYALHALGYSRKYIENTLARNHATIIYHLKKFPTLIVYEKELYIVLESVLNTYKHDVNIELDFTKENFDKACKFLSDIVIDHNKNKKNKNKKVIEITQFLKSMM